MPLNDFDTAHQIFDVSVIVIYVIVAIRANFKLKQEHSPAIVQLLMWLFWIASVVVGIIILSANPTSSMLDLLALGSTVLTAIYGGIAHIAKPTNPTIVVTTVASVLIITALIFLILFRGEGNHRLSGLGSIKQATVTSTAMPTSTTSPSPTATKNAAPTATSGSKSSGGSSGGGGGGIQPTPTPRPRPLGVNSASANITSSTPSGCIYTIQVSGGISTNGNSGTIHYYWLRSDGSQSPGQSVGASNGNTYYSVGDTWEPQVNSSPTTYWDELVVTGPNSLHSNQASETLSC